MRILPILDNQCICHSSRYVEAFVIRAQGDRSRVAKVLTSQHNTLLASYDLSDLPSLPQVVYVTTRQTLGALTSSAASLFTACGFVRPDRTTTAAHRTRSLGERRMTLVGHASEIAAGTGPEHVGLDLNV